MAHKHFRYVCGTHGNMKTQCRCVCDSHGIITVPCGAWCIDHEYSVVLTLDEIKVMRALLAPTLPLPMAQRVVDKLDGAETVAKIMRARVW